MRFQLVLPSVSVILAVVLIRAGDMQIRKIVEIRRHHRGAEPVPDSYARARYFDYALNAPAWAALGDQRGMLWSEGNRWGPYLRYLLAVIGMWYLLGFLIDKRLEARKAEDARPRSWHVLVITALGLPYGLFLCRLMVSEFQPLRDYGYWLPLRKYEPWFIALVLAWGIGLIWAGCNSLLRLAKRIGAGNPQS